jgi:hypothetical protein
MSPLENVAENLSAQETSVVKTSVQKAKKLIQLRPCKAMIIQALKQHDPVGRIYFFNRFLPSLHDGEVDPVVHFCATCSNTDIINPMLCSQNVVVSFA